MMPYRHVVILLLLTLLGAPGCVQQMKEKALQRVAKDWCMTIRASQVIPVYPLMEDLQPGDVFLVQTPIQRQETLYKKNGFLPLDQMVTRLHDLDYRSFYRPAYFQGDYGGVPHARPAPAQPSQPPPPGASSDESHRTGEAPERRFNGAPLPMAAFPSYSFDVNRSFGMRIAVPVQGVPVGLGLMQTDRAIGTITIADGLTYGIDSEDVLRRLRIWADQPGVRQELSDIAGLVPGDLYLRVVTRVYFAGALNVLLQDVRAGGSGIDAGQAQPIQFPDLGGKDPEQVKQAAAAYKEALDQLSGALTSAAPGGSVRLTFASSRAVGMREEFPRPLAVGYLGFDVLVSEDGTLGPPVATRDILDPALRLRPVAPSVKTEVVVTFLATVKSNLEKLGDDEHANELAARLDTAAPVILAVPGRVSDTAYDWTPGTKTLHVRKPPDLRPPADPKFEAVLAQWSRDRNYIRALRAALDTPVAELKISENDAAAKAAIKGDIEALRKQLNAYESMLAAFEYDLRHHPDIVKAVTHHNSRFVHMP